MSCGHVLTRKTRVPLFEGALDVATLHEQVLLESEGRTGGIVVAVGCERQDGTRALQLTHYPVFMIDRHLAAIARLAEPTDRSAQFAQALVYAPDHPGSHIDTITTHLRTVFGSTLVIEHVAYAPSNGENGALRVVTGTVPGKPLVCLI